MPEQQLVILEAILSDCEVIMEAVQLAVQWGEPNIIRNQARARAALTPPNPPSLPSPGSSSICPAQVPFPFLSKTLNLPWAATFGTN